MSIANPTRRRISVQAPVGEPLGAVTLDPRTAISYNTFRAAAPPGTTYTSASRNALRQRSATSKSEKKGAITTSGEFGYLKSYAFLASYLRVPDMQVVPTSIRLDNLAIGSCTFTNAATRISGGGTGPALVTTVGTPFAAWNGLYANRWVHPGQNADVVPSVVINRRMLRIKEINDTQIDFHDAMIAGEVGELNQPFDETVIAAGCGMALGIMANNQPDSVEDFNIQEEQPVEGGAPDFIELHGGAHMTTYKLSTDAQGYVKQDMDGVFAIPYKPGTYAVTQGAVTDEIGLASKSTTGTHRNFIAGFLGNSLINVPQKGGLVSFSYTGGNQGRLVGDRVGSQFPICVTSDDHVFDFELVLTKLPDAAAAFLEAVDLEESEEETYFATFFRDVKGNVSGVIADGAVIDTADEDSSGGAEILYNIKGMSSSTELPIHLHHWWSATELALP